MEQHAEQPQAIPQEHPHPQPRQYIIIAVILTVLTLAEVGIYYVKGLGKGLPVLLIFLSAIKFAAVVGYYMHLKFDSKLFLGMFAFCMTMAISILLALMGLFSAF